MAALIESRGSAPPLLSLSWSALAARLGGPGRASAVFSVLRRGRDPSAEGVLAPGARRRLLGCVRWAPPVCAGRYISADGTEKLRLALADGEEVEAVLIPEARYWTLCISTQVGCARGCSFCQTARMGLRRNLSVDELVGQLWWGLRRVGALGGRLRNLVWMGMGEPLDNLEAVRAALEIITEGRAFGLGPRHITLSTVGPSPRQIRAAAALPARLAWSLHAAEPELRARLVPTARYSPAALRDAFAEGLSGRPLFVELTLIDGVNDDPAALSAILSLFQGFSSPLRFNLLPVNPGRGLRPSRPEAVARMKAGLREAGHFASLRVARGDREAAACGQLVVGLEQATELGRVAQLVEHPVGLDPDPHPLGV